MFTKTEAMRRLRLLTAASRRASDRLSHKVRVEVGEHLRPQATLVHPTYGDCYPEDDDLLDFHDLYDAAAREEVRAHGAIVHLYFSPQGFDDQLLEVHVGWLGTSEHDPVLVEVDGRWVEDREVA